MRVLCGEVAMPRDGVVVEGRMVEHEGTGGVSREARQLFIELERNPLSDGEDGRVGENGVMLCLSWLHIISI